MASQEFKNHKNPLLRPSSHPHGAFPYGGLEFGHYEPAFNEALKAAEARVDALRQEKAEPTFANTIEALEAADEPLEQVGSVFGNMLSVSTTPELQTFAEAINPRLSKFSNDIFFDTQIFARVRAVYEKKDSLGLDAEQSMLLTRTYRAFVRNGALLTDDEKTRVGAIDERLSVIGETYKKNVTDATSAYELFITDKARLAGLPEKAVKGAAQKAKAAGRDGAWLFTLDAPSVTSVLTYADDRPLREEIWRAFSGRAASGGHDNRLVLLEIAKLRQERAAILGYDTHAHYVTEDRMALNPVTVEKFLLKLADAYRPAAIKDLADLKAFAGHDIEPWDAGYFSEKIRESRYGYSEEALTPYFPLDQVLEGAFFAATKRYGITFHPRHDIPTWDKEVRTFEVREKDGTYLALFYLDPYPRKGVKRAGAWMNSIQAAGEFGGVARRPHVINVGNFSEPVDGEPALLTMREVTTVFHELGHGLHGMFANTRYRSLAGTNVAWDFVELPSQMNENWALEDEVLDVYARHYKTGERIPAELVAKVKRALTFQAGLSGLRQISLGMLDLAWHTHDLSGVKTAEDVVAFEQKAMEPYRVLPPKEGALTSASFAHIFAGGYSAGYYSYKWADVLAADAFGVFESEGVFNHETSLRFRREVLEKGGTEEAAVLYRRFRGGDPDPQALLRKEGLLGERP